MSESNPLASQWCKGFDLGYAVGKRRGGPEAHDIGYRAGFEAAREMAADLLEEALAGVQRSAIAYEIRRMEPPNEP